jgi:hypothetical protein
MAYGRHFASWKPLNALETWHGSKQERTIPHMPVRFATSAHARRWPLSLDKRAASRLNFASLTIDSIRTLTYDGSVSLALAALTGLVAGNTKPATGMPLMNGPRCCSAQHQNRAHGF